MAPSSNILELSVDDPWTIRKHAVSIPLIFKGDLLFSKKQTMIRDLSNERFVNIPWIFREYSVNIPWMFREYSVNFQGGLAFSKVLKWALSKSNRLAWSFRVCFVNFQGLGNSRKFTDHCRAVILVFVSQSREFSRVSKSENFCTDKEQL